MTEFNLVIQYIEKKRAEYLLQVSYCDAFLDEVKELSDMLKQGLITQEDYVAGVMRQLNGINL